jgi:oligopeptide/dipeptide ABC transporter ATP-binding protein
MVDASLRATILENLRQLHVDFGISFIYITHDLTTAYQISHSIVVLYRGAIAEAGDVDLVIQRPLHPYSQLLVASIPEPSVEHRWADDETPPVIELSGPVSRGCAFADRCPYVMDVCREIPPPLFRTDTSRAAACFLHRESPVIDNRHMDQLLMPAGPPDGRGP